MASPTAHPSSTPPQTVCVVGAGLVGALASAMLASRGFTVTLLESRPDPRLPSLSSSRARSINLALSPRGIEALRSVSEELVERVLQEGIPMRGRMLHKKSAFSGAGGLDLEGQDYGYFDEGECIRSISRTQLGNFLLDHLDGLPKEGRGSVAQWFETKLVEMDLRGERGVDLTVASREGGQRKEHFDWIIGADGAYSRVRREMMRGSKTRFNYSQSYAPHSYLELSLPPGPDNTYSISPSHLHIWPRGEFMLIALPNLDRSFTLTLFAHQSTFDSLDHQLALSDDEQNKIVESEEGEVVVNPVVKLFRDEFKDALDLMGEEELMRSWRENPKDGLITVECSPYHYEDKVLLLGDAAHAMVPFYGQGMNCGFEDVRFLSTLLDHFCACPSPLIPSPLPHSSLTAHSLPSPTSSTSTPLARCLATYTTLRTPSLLAIQRLAAHNYSEMAASVLNPLYLLRLALDRGLTRVFRVLGKDSEQLGGTWDSLYRMVTFKWGLAYEEAQRRRDWQQGCLEAAVKVALVAIAGGAGWVGYSMRRKLMQ